MPVDTEAYRQITSYLEARQVTLVAVSKTKPVGEIQSLYNLGHRDFGENYVQELLDKHQQLPPDIRWHFIGHLQTNKVKFLAPFIHLIHGVDSLKLLQEIQKQAVRAGRTIDVLLQVHIAREETKFGLDESEVMELIQHSAVSSLDHVRIRGLMGMASFTENEETIRQEFASLRSLYDRCHELAGTHAGFRVLSMGMSGDYRIAIEAGSNMVRIGSLLFGARPA